MKQCIDCHKFLTKKNRSTQQPNVRCSECFPAFNKDLKQTLQAMITEMSTRGRRSEDK